MSHNESNIVSLKLSEYVAKSDAEKIDRKGWVNYGTDNDFPQYIRDLSHESPVHGSLTVAIGDMIAGKGIQSEQYQAELDALDIDHLTYACSHDLKVFGGFYIEVIWSNDRTMISKLNAIPFEECRIAIDQEDETEIGIFHSYDWSNARKKKNTPEFIPKYNYLTREVEPRQIYWCFTYTGSDVYPRPDYWSAINYIELDKQISIFHINQILNGLFPSTIINFYNGQATPEQKQQMMMDWENKMSGARNAGKVVMFFNERDQPKTEITPFPVNDADKQYQLMNDTATQKIITAHRVTTPLLFGIRDGGTGFGSNKDEMATGLEIFNNQVIEPYQHKINHSLEELLSNQMPGVTFEIIPNTPLAIQEAEVVADVTGGASTDVAATALNGAQIASLVDIVMQSAAGAVPVSSAKAIVQAAFPTLPPATIDAIFADVIAGSLLPSEVVASTQLKKKVASVEFDDDTAGDALIALGEDASADWILIDSFNADDEINHEFAVRTGTARPAAKSEQDAVIDGKYFITRYVYAGSFTHENMRPFCKKMIEAGKLYRKEDITQMENVAVNPGWGPEGAMTYDIWFYKGGGNCRHFWEKRVYVDAKGAKINPNDPDASRIAVAMAERMGYKVRNNQLVAKLPEDMPHNGFLPSNPVYGNQ
jgi:hypothetical protein